MSEFSVAFENPFPFLMIPDAIWGMTISHDAIVTYLRVIHHANRATHEAWPSRKSMAEAVFPGLSWERARKRLDAAVSELVALGMLRKEARKRADGSATSNRYLITRETAWNKEKAGGVGLPDDPGVGLPDDPTQGCAATPLEPDPNNQIQSNQGSGSLTQGRCAPSASPSNLPVQDSHSLFDEANQGTASVAALPLMPPSASWESAEEGIVPKEAKATVLDASPSLSLSTLPSKPLKASKAPSEGSLVWDAYSRAYAHRYGADPIRNAKQNALCSQLVQRLGSLAPAVAAFYVSHPNGFYAQNMHALGLAVKDAESLAVQLQRGEKMTQTKARQIDKDGALGDVAERTLRRIEERAAERRRNGDFS